jgi:hypothetical protein
MGGALCKGARGPRAADAANRPLLPPLHPDENLDRVGELHANGAPHNAASTPSWKKDHIKVVTTPLPVRQGIDSVEFTPMANSEYKYYCPLCMLYFKGSILVTSCCKNYICYGCALGFVAGKAGIAGDAKAVPCVLPDLPCPHCAGDGVQLAYVAANATPRNYSDSPSVTRLLSQVGEDTATPGGVKRLDFLPGTLGRASPPPPGEEQKESGEGSLGAGAGAAAAEDMSSGVESKDDARSGAEEGAGEGAGEGVSGASSGGAEGVVDRVGGVNGDGARGADGNAVAGVDGAGASEEAEAAAAAAAAAETGVGAVPRSESKEDMSAAAPPVVAAEGGESDAGGLLEPSGAQGGAVVPGGDGGDGGNGASAAADPA